MSNVRKTIISNCEKQFLIKNLSEWKRLDGRAFDEFREVKIEFGKDWGCCYVSLGKTRVIAQVSCELQQPKSSRPSEGILNINLELNPMADPNFEAGRQSDLSSQLNRLLEKCIKDSKAVDLESLCVKMNERVWALRVDINVLNHEGNILDCASIAALASLAHFRRPDVTSDGEEFKIHSIKQRDPIPTVIHHYPVCVSYAIFSGGDYILADPNLLEEGVAEAFMSVGLNSYKELCGLHLGGKVEITTNIILETTNKAAKRACEIVEVIKEAVENDTNERLAAKGFGFHKSLNLEDVNIPLSDLRICLDHWSTTKNKKKKKNVENMEVVNDDVVLDGEVKDTEDSIEKLGNGTAELVPQKGNGGWDIVISDQESDDEVVYVEQSKVQMVEIPDSNSEEENVLVLNAEEKKSSPKKKRKLKS